MGENEGVGEEVRGRDWEERKKGNCSQDVKFSSQERLSSLSRHDIS